MTGGRGRRGSLAKRGRDREANEQLLMTPPAMRLGKIRLHGYLTRHSKATTLGRCATSNMSLIRGIKITPAQHCTSQQSPEASVHHATSASSFSIPHNTVFVPTNFGDSQSNKKDKCVTSVGNSVMAGSTNCSAHESPEVVRVYPLPSFNVTEYVQKQQEDLDDNPEEVESDHAFVCVNGHKVKKGIAPLLKDIFEKYGDITTGSDIKPSNFLSYYLERVCDVYGSLAQTTLDGVTRIQLTNMLDEVVHLEHQKLNLGWLRERLEYISQSKACIHEYFTVKEEVAKNEAYIGIQKEKLEGYRRELADLHKKISATEEELIATETKFDENKKKYLDIRARITSLKNNISELTVFAEIMNYH